MFPFRQLSQQIRRQISTSKPIKFKLAPTHVRLAPALYLSISNLQTKTSSISDSYNQQEPPKKPNKNDSWTNIDKYSEEEREQLLEDATIQSREKTTQRTNRYGLPAFLAFLMGMGVAWFGYYDITEEQSKKSEAFEVHKRASLALNNFLKMLDDLCIGSVDDQLLPPRQQPPPGYISLEPNYILVIEPIRCLVVPEYDLKNGWRMRKRQGFKRFCDAVKWDRQTGQHSDYEVIAWTNKPLMDFQETTMVLQSQGFQGTPLYREACQYILNLQSIGQNGNYAPKPYYKKPIDRLNRDLKKLIIIDYDERAFEDFPENGLKLPLAPDDPMESDLTLHDLTRFLMHLVSDQVDDVRPIIKYYSQFGDKWLDEFRKNSEIEEEVEVQPSEEEIMRARLSSFSNTSWFKR